MKVSEGKDEGAEGDKIEELTEKSRLTGLKTSHCKHRNLVEFRRHLSPQSLSTIPPFSAPPAHSDL